MTHLPPSSSTRAALGAFWQGVRDEIAQDRLLYAAIFSYALATAVLAFLLGTPQKLVFFSYLTIWLRAVLTIGLVYVTVTEVPASVRANPEHPLDGLFDKLPRLLTARLVAGAALILALALMMGAFTSVKNMLVDVAPFRWDGRLAAADAWLHGGMDPWRLLQPFLGYQSITRAIQHLYAAGWLLALCAVPAAFATSRRLAPFRRRFFLTYVICWIALGNVMAGLFMSAGPVYYGQATGDAARFAEQLRYLSFSAGLPNSSIDLQRDLWALHEAGRVELGSGISAFPSLHISMVTLFALAAWSVNRTAGWIAVAFLAAILLGSVHLAWHYAIDDYAAILVTAAIWFSLAAVQHRTHRRS